MPKYAGMQQVIQKFRDHRSQAYMAAGEEKIAEIHLKDLLIARERVEAPPDTGTFCEHYLFAETISREFGLDRKRYPGDGAIVAFGEIDRRRVCITANDSLIMGGQDPAPIFANWPRPLPRR